MRESQYRGKRVDTKEWVYGYYFTTPLTIENFGVGHLGDSIKRHCISNDDGVVFEVIPETIGQYIGAMAKGQKEVYEDDIVKWGYRYHENPIRIAIVKLSPDIQLICLNLKGFDGMAAIFHWGNFAYNKCFNEDGEVIGNKWDNPELLK